MKKGLILVLCLCLLAGCKGKDKNESIIIEEIPNTTEVVNESSYAPIEADNVTNFTTTWHTSYTDGYIESIPTYNSQNCTIHNGGSNMLGATLVHDGVPLLKGNEYHVSFDVNSSISRKIEVLLVNIDNGHVYQSSVFDVNGQGSYEFNFTMNEDTNFNARIQFNLGYDGTDLTKEYHTVDVQNIFISNLSNRDYSVKANHIGYTNGDQKRFTLPSNQGDCFRVINTDTRDIVYVGALIGDFWYESTGEHNFYGDFTNVTDSGNYRIETQVGGTSYDFSIGSNLFDPAFDELLRFISLQRCGSNLDSTWADGYSHEQCHDTHAIVYDSENQAVTKDVTGGWHDAGDYGRYVQTGSKSVVDLLLAYLSYPSVFDDNSGIAESGNGIADVLDEARYELEWLLKMQEPTGEVHNKVVTKTFPSITMEPQNDKEQLYLMQPMSVTTANFVAVTALAAIAYRGIDEEFATKCLNASTTSWGFLKDKDYWTVDEPTDFSSGVYRDNYDLDERFFASMALWAATKEKQYLDYGSELAFRNDDMILNGTTWRNVGTYGKYVFLLQADAAKHKELYKFLKNSLIDEAKKIADSSAGNAYNVSLYEYAWGSNGKLAENAMVLVMADRIEQNQYLKQSAHSHLDYLFGKNCLNISFISGFGDKSPQDVHHRIAVSRNMPIYGALVGGPDGIREDAITQSKFSESTPGAWVYVDNHDSFSTNEVTVYWNSSLIFVLSALKN